MVMSKNSPDRMNKLHNIILEYHKAKMRELLLHTSTWIYFIQNVKMKKQVAEYTHSIIPYCTKFGILKLNTHLINIHAYNVSRKPYKGLMLL